MDTLRYKISILLRKLSNKLYAKSVGAPSNIIPNIGANRLSKNPKRALVIYTMAAVRQWFEGKVNQFDLTKHTIYWESIEMINLLNQQGYLVDYVDERSHPIIDVTLYDLIIDHGDNLKDCPSRTDQKKIHWTSGNHWLVWNAAELERIRMFYERTGILVPMNRQVPNNSSDEYADYLTYFGTDLQKDSFSKKPKKVQINISSAFVPPYIKKDFAQAKKKFLWIGGGGAIHKGLDIVIEAFQKLKDAELFIVGNLRDEPRFWQWAEPILAGRANMHAIGRFDLTSPVFDAIADQCVGVVYASAAEGGPGSIARVLHNGLIPIVTPTSFVRAEHLGYRIAGHTDHELIASTVNHVATIMETQERALEERSEAVREFARAYHTREAFSQSFRQLLENL